LRRVILAIVGTAAGLVLLLSFKAHSTGALTMPPAAISGAGGPAGPASTSSAGGAVGGSTSKGATSGNGTSGSKGATGSKGAATTGSSAPKTVTGGVAQTIYGPVQVKITVKNGKVTAADAVQYPGNSSYEVQLNAYAIPVLNHEAVAASSARIDAVSGATYTSQGYISSLQSAIDKAGL
jgi:uncharacterized protein with FMN-binding domain